jgi:hypothetical protein
LWMQWSIQTTVNLFLWTCRSKLPTVLHKIYCIKQQNQPHIFSSACHSWASPCFSFNL